MDSHLTFHDAIQKLDENGDGVLALTDRDGFFIGLITDGDVRRAILNQNLDLEHVVNKYPYKLTSESTKEERSMYLRESRRRHLPIVDKNNRLVEIFTLGDKGFRIMPNPVVIMAGGLGKRLGVLTKDTPKPMLHVGDKPLLDTILSSFIECGFHKFYISVNYRKDVIIDYFGNGSKWGIDIVYLIEDKRLGTAGALSLIKEKHDEQIIVANGDVLTSMDYEKLLNFHVEKKAMATMCVRKYEHIIPYGVIELEDNEIVRLSEKPKITFNVNTGIYIIDPHLINSIPLDTFYDMPELFNYAIKNKYKTCAYTMADYWIDVGHAKTFSQVNKDIRLK
mgnify:CR=1 FL=1